MPVRSVPSRAPVPAATWWRRLARARGVGPARVALAAIAAHGSVLAGGFVWLDHAHLLEGLALAPPARLHLLFTQGFAGTGFYRPLMALSLSLDAALGFGPVGFHAVTLLWHALASALVVLAGRALGLPGRVPELGGALFAVHPLGSLVAGAIAFRSEAMLAAGLLGLVVCHRAGRPWASAACLAGAALVKETGLVLGPLLVVALELSRDGGACAAERRRRRIVVLGAEASALALALGLRLVFAPGWRSRHPPLSVTEALGTRAALLARAVARFFWPADVELCDAFPVVGLTAPSAWLGLSVAAGLAVAAWRGRGLWLLLALALLPSLQLVPVMRWWSPHYLYLPAAFGCPLLVDGMVRMARAVRARWPALAGPARRPVLGGAALLLLAALGATSFARGRRQAGDEALWGPEVAREPGCREGRFYLGQVALARGQPREAIAHLEVAVAQQARLLSYVDQAAALQNLGVARLQSGDGAGALAAFEAALPLVEPGLERRRLVHNLAAAELGLGRAAEAAARLADEAARADALPESLALYAGALARLGRRAEAEALLRGGVRAAGDVAPGSQ